MFAFAGLPVLLLDQLTLIVVVAVVELDSSFDIEVAWLRTYPLAHQ